MLVACQSQAQERPRPSSPSFSQLPLGAGPEFQPLRQLEDVSLQTRLNTALAKRPDWQKLIAGKHLAIGLVDMQDPQRIRFAQVNGDEMMYAASLPKIAILLAAADAMERNELKETEEIRRDLRLMISKSNNQASTRMIDRLGYDRISRTLTDPRYELYDLDHGGGLWVGKRYAAGGARNPDPMKGLSHAATAEQVCRFYYLLIHGKLVSPQRSRQMLSYMEKPELHHKFVYALDRLAPRARVFRKSGSWQQYHCDSALVWGPERRYILVALAQSPQGEKIMRDLVFSVEKALQVP